MNKKNLKISPCSTIRGELNIPGDKSISHRSIILSSLAWGESRISNFLMSEDCLNTLNAFRKLGVLIKQNGASDFIVSGKGLGGLIAPEQPLYLGNSGTGMRLITGVLAAQNFKSTVIGDESLSKRPMKRIVLPLTKMGARIDACNGNYPPLNIHPASLNPITYALPVASAQVKSAILLAGLHISGTTTIIEPIQSRDHTERMLAYFGADIVVHDNAIFLNGGKQLTAKNIIVPGDISSAAFFLVAASAMPGASLILKDIGLNPTRDAIIGLLERMGANISIHRHELNLSSLNEPRGDIHITGTQLRGITISGSDIPIAIDELPVLAVAGVLAKGTTIIKDAGELRVKESDRISCMVTNLCKIGCSVEEHEDGMIIRGGNPLHGAEVDSFGDHRIAMALSIAGLFIDEGCLMIKNTKNIDTSFPEYESLLKKILIM